MENTRLQKTANVIDVIVKIVRGFALAAAIVCAIFIPLMLIFRDKMISYTGDIYIGGVNIKLACDPLQAVDMSKLIAGICIELGAVIVSAMFAWYFLGVTRSILSPMKEGRPFETGISDKIRKLGWTTLIGGGVSELVKAIAQTLQFNSYNIEKLVSPAVKELNYSADFSFWFVGAALIIFFLAYIFRYGEGLQKESDETL